MPTIKRFDLYSISSARWIGPFGTRAAAWHQAKDNMTTYPTEQGFRIYVREISEDAQVYTDMRPVCTLYRNDRGQIETRIGV